MNSYLRLLSFFLLTGFVLVSASSYLIDPYGLRSNTADLFQRKVAAADKGRTIKPYQVKGTVPFTLLVGNSRVEIGMPAQHAFYQQQPVYNMGLPGAGVAMQYDYARHVIALHDSVKQVVIALDILDFTSTDSVPLTDVNRNWAWRLSTAPDSWHTHWRQFSEQLGLLFSLSAINDSLYTVLWQNADVNALNRSGFNDGGIYQYQVKHEGFAALYRQKDAELSQRLQHQALAFNLQSYQMRELDQFISSLKEKGIQPYLLINPYQKPYLQLLAQYQLQDDLIAWKAALAELAAQHQLPIYDFAIASDITDGVVELSSHNEADSPYFWEPAHYRPALGTLMLDALMQQQCDKLCRLISD